MDRQYANAVGKAPLTVECQSYGQKLGKCGRLIFAGPDGILGRLCDVCERDWLEANKQLDREVKAMFNIDEKTEIPI